MSKENGWMSVHATVVDLSRSRGGPHNLNPLDGMILHVNVSEDGTPDSFWSAGKNENPYSVCPTFQVMKSREAGGLRQFLPMLYEPWCQMVGNATYGAIETAGMPDEPLTSFQVSQIALVMCRMHQWYGVPLTVANKPGQRGLGTHQMGGAAWGGHPCPGKIRSKQRKLILSRAQAMVDWYAGHGKTRH